VILVEPQGIPVGQPRTRLANLLLATISLRCGWGCWGRCASYGMFQLGWIRDWQYSLPRTPTEARKPMQSYRTISASGEPRLNQTHRGSGTHSVTNYDFTPRSERLHWVFPQGGTACFDRVAAAPVCTVE